MAEFAPGVEIRPEPLGSETAAALISELNAELSLNYTPEQRFHALPAEDVADGNGAFLVIWLDGEPAGCGAVRRLAAPDADAAELKRMYVRPAVRSRGLSKQLLAMLESTAHSLGVTRLVLETGIYQAAAIGLYESAGYRRIPPFGPYVTSAASVCMEKRI